MEYLKDDLVLVIMKTISNSDNINMHTHGFSMDGIPEAGDTVRIDLVGGFVIQRITKERSFFRAIANMDIKLDIVPPWLINFMSRQLIGSGHKLYQKAVSTVATSDEDYKQALRAPLYVRIREYKNSAGKAKVAPVEQNDTAMLPKNLAVQSPLAITNLTPNSEIVEEEDEQDSFFKVDHLASGSSNQPAEQAQQVKNKPYISPEVEQALGILDTAIAVLQGSKVGNISALQKFFSYDATLEGNAAGSRKLNAKILDGNNIQDRHSLAMPPRDPREILQAYSSSQEKMRNKEEDAFNSDSPKSTATSAMTKTKPMTLRSVTRVHEEESLNTNGLHQNGLDSDKKSKRQRKANRWLCCLATTTIG